MNGTIPVPLRYYWSTDGPPSHRIARPAPGTTLELVLAATKMAAPTNGVGSQAD